MAANAKGRAEQVAKHGPSIDPVHLSWQDVVSGATIAVAPTTDTDFGRNKSKERLVRTRTLLESINQAAATAVLPARVLSRQEKAAVICQKYVRAKLARKEFAARLYKRYVKDEEERQERQREQVEEGEAMLALRRMESELENAAAIAQSKERRKVDAATRIQRAWRCYHDYQYYEDFDWDSMRINPFSGVVPVKMVSAFGSPSRSALAMAAADQDNNRSDDDYHGDSDPSGSVPSAGIAAASTAGGPVFARTPSTALRIHQEYAQDDWEMTPVQETAPLAIAQLEAQLQAMEEMEQCIDSHLPTTLFTASDEQDDNGDDEGSVYDEDGDEGDAMEEHEHGPGGSIDNGRQGRSSDFATAGETHAETSYRPRSLDVKSASLLELHRGKPTGHSYVTRGSSGSATSFAKSHLSSGDADDEMHSSYSQSVGDIYQICYDSEEFEVQRGMRRVSRAASTESNTSFGQNAKRLQRRSPDGSSGPETPVYETSGQSTEEDITSKQGTQLGDVARQHEQAGVSEAKKYGALSAPLASSAALTAAEKPANHRPRSNAMSKSLSMEANPPTPSSASPSASLVPIERQYEVMVLESKWMKRHLTPELLQKLSPTQLQCIQAELNMLKDISSDELIRQLELRDDHCLRREEFQQKADELTRAQKAAMDERKKKILAFGQPPKSHRRFGIFSRKSTR